MRYITVTYGQTIGKAGYSSEQTSIAMEVPLEDDATDDECLKAIEFAHTQIKEKVEEFTNRVFEED